MVRVNSSRWGLQVAPPLVGRLAGRVAHAIQSEQRASDRSLFRAQFVRLTRKMTDDDSLCDLLPLPIEGSLLPLTTHLVRPLIVHGVEQTLEV